jgi:NAD(P)-dependent dehydrogenase (short-subunit alcohol dehydrogenase family)
MSDALLFIGTRTASGLAAGLAAELQEAPAVAFDPAWSSGPLLEEWRSKLLARPPFAGVVVAMWPDSPRPSLLVDLDLDGWVEQFETRFALWFAALAAGSDRCAGDGQVIAVVDRPDPMQGAGWATEAAVADAVENMVRSFAQIHHPRGVRVNLVTTPARTTAAAPASVDEVEDSLVGAVTMLLSGHDAGLTASVVHLPGRPR